MVTHQLQVERRTGKVRRPETDVLPLCHATNLGVLYPTFSRYKRPSFELKLRRNAWAAGVLPRTPLGELTALPYRPLARLRALLLKGRVGRGGKVKGKGRGSGTPSFGEKVTPLFSVVVYKILCGLV